MSEAAAPTWGLTPQQLAFYETFGFLRLPGLFAAEADRIVAGFEEVFAANPVWETNEQLHFDQTRQIIPMFIDKSDDLAWLRRDPRVISLVTSLIGDGWESAESDGNLFYCDTSWHPDTYGAPLHLPHVKLSFYLDPLKGENGAIRMIPGSNDFQSPYAVRLRGLLREPAKIPETLGVNADQIPSWTLESEPGDVIAWNFRTIHASFNGGQRRRLFSINFSGREAA